MKQFTINSNLTLSADEVVNAANNILSTYHIFFCAADSSLATGTQEDDIVLWPEEHFTLAAAESEANEWAADIANDVASDYSYIAEGYVDHDDYPDDDDWYEAVDEEMEQSLSSWVEQITTLNEICEAIDELHGGIQAGAIGIDVAELEYIRAIFYVLDEARAALAQEEK
nr:MAG TPA: hypothetical protein [Caudoviricetes sp.]